MNPAEDPWSLTTAPRWTQGAWTPARCALWRLLTPQGQQRLETWVNKERTLPRNMTFNRQLPPKDQVREHMK